MNNDFNYALAKAMRFCSTKEVCIWDISKKLNDWKIEPEFHQKIIDNLIDEKFIDETRYAEAFALDKFKFNKWGKIKIKFQLRQKNIQENLIDNALVLIEEKDYEKTANTLITSKLKTVKSDDYFIKKNKVLSSLANKGYETDLIYRLTDIILSNQNKD